jgi:hypothetical protein
MSIEITGLSFNGFGNIKFTGGGGIVDEGSKLIIGGSGGPLYTFGNTNQIDQFTSNGISLQFSAFSTFAMGTNIEYTLDLVNSEDIPIASTTFKLESSISLTNITNLKATATFTNCDSLSSGFSLYIGEGTANPFIAGNKFTSSYSIKNSPQLTIYWSDFETFNPTIGFPTGYVLWSDNEGGNTFGVNGGYGTPGVVITTFSLNASYINAIEDANATGFKVVYDTLYTSSSGDSLEISGGDTGGTTYSYTLPNGSVVNGGTKTYTYANFTGFTPTSDVEYDLTLKVTAGSAGSGKVKYIATSTPFIQTSQITPSDLIVTITNYTTLNGDKLVITPLSGSPSHELPIGTTDFSTYSFTNDFSTTIAANVVYTMTLKKANNDVVASDTFTLPAVTNPSFVMGTVTASDFTIDIVQYYTPVIGDSLEIKSTGGSTLATYQISGDDIGVDFARTYAYDTFGPPSFTPTPGTSYNLVLSSVISGYFSPAIETLLYAPSVAPLVITNISINGFTVDYTYKPGNITGYKLSIVETDLPLLLITTNPTQPVPYLFTEFSPEFFPSQNILYTVNLISGEDIVMSGRFMISGPQPVPCFRAGSLILCEQNGLETYLPIETLKPGMRVKTSSDGFLPIDMIGHTTLQNPGHADRIQNRLYKCSKADYPTLSEDLYITGCHSILVDDLTEAQKQATLTQLKDIFVTKGKYRLMACIDERATPHADEAEYTIWHIALENNEYYHNYGIWANGLLVETCSKRYLKELSGMTLVV